MKLIQFHLPNLGKRVGIVTREEEVIDVTSEDSPNVLEILELAHREQVSLGVILADIQEKVATPTPIRLQAHPDEENATTESDGLTLKKLDVAPAENVPHLLAPIDSPEVWGCGVTYKRSADMRDDDSEQDIYSRVYYADRPEIFFKATPSRCVGPNGFIGIRSDSALTATEPELAYVLGDNGEIIGYTLCNDVSAWDIERDNPLYLPQSKVFYGCCALGPMFVTPSEVDDPYNLDMTCTVLRGDEVIYEGSVNTSQINWKFEQLTEFLMRDNPIPFGTVVSTGTGIIVPNDLPLAAGDLVKIEIDGFGTLANPVKQL
ncbi:MAG: fumarylacetoacetate hydrolase family protein [Candidatus Poribacteria bacterium]|nr:fumarylacetoacetate hydrolase family protein [Candidatus Poribacteria bacterium]MYK20176.1 2-keto-3-deoxy-D-arabinonate dehydratase [Candidatus Poribacteria bacterium]